MIALAVLSVLLSSAALAAQGSASEVRALMISVPSDSVDFMVGGRLVSIDDGDVIPGAQIFFAGTTLGTLADSDGMFRLDAGAPGPVELRVRLIGYVEACVKLELAADTMRSVLIALPRARTLTPPSVDSARGCISPETESPR